MTKKTIWVLVGVILLGAGAAVYYKFSGTTKHISLIPKDAQFVVRIDAKSLADKIELKGEFQNTQLYKKSFKDEVEGKGGTLMTRIIRRTIKNPSKVGIDVFSDFYYTETKVSNESFTMLIGALSDADNFKETINKMPGAKDGGILTDKNFTYFVSKGSILAWDNNGFIYMERKYSMFDFWGGGGEQKMPMVNAAKYIFNLKDTGSMKADKDFEAFIDEDADVSYYINYSNIIGEKSDEFTKIKDTKAKELMSGIISMKLGAFLNFENDKIVINSKIYSKSNSIDQLNIFKKEGLSEEALQSITDKDALLTYALNIDTDKLKSLIEVIDLATKTKESSSSYESEAYGYAPHSIESQINGALQPIGLNYKELLKGIKGDVCLAITGIKDNIVKKYDYQLNPLTNDYDRVEIGTETKKLFVGTMSIGFNSTDVLNKVYNSFPMIDSLNQQRGIVIPDPELSNFKFIVTTAKNRLFISNDIELVNKIHKNGRLDGHVNDEAESLLKKNAASIYMNLDPSKYKEFIFSYTGESANNNKNANKFITFMSLFEDIQARNEGLDGEFVINLKSGRGNSLLRMLKQADVFFVE